MGHHHQHGNHDQLKETVAFRSILVSALITIAKAIGGMLTGSLALISDALHSLLDVVFTTITWFAIRKAHQPADEDHQFGHGKIESMAALIETVFLLLLAGVIAFQSYHRLMTGSAEIVPHGLAFVILIGAIALDAWRWYSLRKVAKLTHSEALEADALHFASDLVNSLMVLAAFGAILLGFKQADTIAALIVAVFIAISGIRLAIRTINTLIDTAPAGLSDIIRREAEMVPGVALVESVRVRPAGGAVFGEIHVQVSRTLPLDKVVLVKKQIAAAVAAEVPNAELTVIADPVQLNNETLFERIMLISAKQRLPIHNVIIQNIDSRLSVGCDLEVDGRLSLAAAHMLATRLEAAIRNEFGDDTEVETHIEPLNANPLDGKNLSEEETAQIARTLMACAEQDREISHIHSVRARTSSAGLVVNYHCYVDPSRTVTEVHDSVDRIERLFRANHPDVIRVVGHAEPDKTNASQTKR